MLDTHTGTGARGRPRVCHGGTGSLSPRLPWLLARWQAWSVALGFVACPLAPRAAAQAAMDRTQVGRVQGQVGAQLAADDVVDGAGPGMAAQVADIGGGQYPGPYPSPWPARGPPVLVRRGSGEPSWR